MEAAKAALGLGDESSEPDKISEEDRQEAIQRARENEAGKAEMAELKKSQLQDKADSARSNAIIGWVSLAAAPVLFLLIAHKPTAVRIALACLAFSVIQFFVWRDAVKAGEELKKEKTS